MSEKNISDQILDKIKNVKPKPRWQFLFKDYMVWFLASLALVVSSLSFAVVLYMMIDNDWDVYTSISNSLLEFVFLTLPYFWLLFLGIFILIAYYYFRHTKKGYKFSLSKIFLASLIINILMGTFLYNIGVGKTIDNVVSQKVPFYKELINRRQHIWSRIDDGLLGGVIVFIEKDYIVIKDIEGHDWVIKHFNTSTPGFLSLEIGHPVRIVGQKIDEQNFEMYRILPMRGMHWMRERCLAAKEDCPLMNERNFLNTRSN
jgi:hypothetical protein